MNSLRILSFIITAIVVIVFSTLIYCSKPINYSAIGTLVILGFTLFVLIQYAYDTHRMAEIQHTINLTPRVVHNITATESTITANTFDIGLDLINHSPFYVEVVVNTILTCYGIELRIPNDVYYGSRPWNLPPNSHVHGHFTLNNDLLEPAGFTLDQLRLRGENPEMLNLRINIKCSSRHAIDYQIPEIRYHFVFDRITIPGGTRWSGWVLNI